MKPKIIVRTYATGVGAAGKKGREQYERDASELAAEGYEPITSAGAEKWSAFGWNVGTLVVTYRLTDAAAPTPDRELFPKSQRFPARYVSGSEDFQEGTLGELLSGSRAATAYGVSFLLPWAKGLRSLFDSRPRAFQGGLDHLDHIKKDPA